MLPEDMIKEFQGKNVIITIFSRTRFKGVIRMVENNWVLLEQKDGTRMLNGSLIRDIKEVK